MAGTKRSFGMAAAAREACAGARLLDGPTDDKAIMATLLEEMLMVSMRQPVPEPPLSVPQRQRNWMVWPPAANGRLTAVVIYPLELPLQAYRPASGLL